MNDIAKCAVSSIIGLSIGCLISWKYFEKKYRDISNDEIESVKEYYKSKYENKKDIDDKKDKDQEKSKNFRERSSLDIYKAALGNFNYSNQNKEQVEKNDDIKNPYVISPSDFGTEDGYETITLSYYIGGTDKVLADDMDEPIYDIDDVVGDDALTQFGTYEEDCVYVRNEKYKCDYEICLDKRSWEEVTGDKKPSED